LEQSPQQNTEGALPADQSTVGGMDEGGDPEEAALPDNTPPDAPAGVPEPQGAPQDQGAMPSDESFKQGFGGGIGSIAPRLISWLMGSDGDHSALAQARQAVDPQGALTPGESNAKVLMSAPDDSTKASLVQAIRQEANFAAVTARHALASGNDQAAIDSTNKWLGALPDGNQVHVSSPEKGMFQIDVSTGDGETKQFQLTAPQLNEFASNSMQHFDDLARGGLPSILDQASQSGGKAIDPIPTAQAQGDSTPQGSYGGGGEGEERNLSREREMPPTGGGQPAPEKPVAQTPEIQPSELAGAEKQPEDIGAELAKRGLNPNDVNIKRMLATGYTPDEIARARTLNPKARGGPQDVNARQAAWIEEQRAEKQKQTSAEAASRGRGAEAAETNAEQRKQTADARNETRLAEKQLEMTAREHMNNVSQATKLKLGQAGGFFKMYAADRAAGKDPDLAELKKWARSQHLTDEDAMHGFNLFQAAQRQQAQQQQAPAPIQGQGGGAEGGQPSQQLQKPPPDMKSFQPNVGYETPNGPMVFINGKLYPATLSPNGWVPKRQGQ